MMKFGCVVFNARCYASTVLAIIMYLFVPSHRYCTKMAKHRITQATLHNSPGIPVFWCQRSRRNSNGHSNGCTKCRWARL